MQLYIQPDQLKESYDNLVLEHQKMNSFLGLLSLLLHGEPIGENYRKTDMVAYAKHLDEVFFLGEEKPVRTGTKYWYTLFQPHWVDEVMILLLKGKRVSLQDCAIALMWHRSFEDINELIATFKNEINSHELIETCFSHSITQQLISRKRCTNIELQKIFQVAPKTLTIGFDGKKFLSKAAGDISAAPYSQTLYAGTSFRKAFSVCDFDFLATYQLKPTQIVKQKSALTNLDIAHFAKILRSSNLSFPPTLPYRFVSSLLTKPFVILTGLSGSGKTKLAEAFSLWISESEAQYCMVAVGADWTNRDPLLGFPNALGEGQYVKPDSGALDLIIRAGNDQAKPYFLILDEMNMSHVERYFADFLSAMESTDGTISFHPDTEIWNSCDVPHEIKLPKNLFIIGTVNIDETTYMFSPKVLDRANVLEFRVSKPEMESFLGEPQELNMDALRGAGTAMGESFVAKALQKGVTAEDLGTELMPFFEKLQEAGAEFGYRTASEIGRFVAICKELAIDPIDANIMTQEDLEHSAIMARKDIIDVTIIQKLLPKVHGSRNKIEKILKELGQLCLEQPENDPFQVNEENEDKHPVKYSLSYEKLKRMHKRVISDGFTSFAEA